MQQPRTKREYLRHLVAAKNQWSCPLSDEVKAAGFLGWHERGYLPHCDYPGLTQFVTFRLIDTMPASRRNEWEHLLSIENVAEKRTKLEEYLDRGMGRCWFRDPQISHLVEASLQHHHNVQYELLAWCVMPNHVHVLLRIWKMPLGKIIQSWKRYVATRAFQLIRSTTFTAPGNNDGFWEREYWDTFMRDEKQEHTAIRYIENNPVKARLCGVAAEWGFSSARFRNDKGLVLVDSP